MAGESTKRTAAHLMRAASWALICLMGADPALAASLPPHAPLRILIVSDEVNPHGLSDAELTQPGDLSAAIGAPASGISIDPEPEGLLEIATNDLPQATSRLQIPSSDPAAYDVLLYFAHRNPTTGSGIADQAAFVAAVEQFLIAGGGVVSFHHGSYLGSGKTDMQELIGASATGSVPWNTVEGQTVINVAPEHFVTSWSIEYSGTTAYDDPAFAIPAASYDSFANVPDERYPQFAVNPSAGTLEVLFASDYDQNGDRHLLGFTHRQPGWVGIVVAYQPGEYQPNALDDLAGNNFQILANSLLFAARAGAIELPSASPGVHALGVMVLMLTGVALRPRPARSPGRSR